MLNELFQAAAAMQKRELPSIEVHPAVEPMGQNKELLLIELDAKANPKSLKVLPGREAGSLVRIAHGSEGSSFPGFNLPLPLRICPEKGDEKYVSKLNALITALQARDFSGPHARAIADLFPETSPAGFTDGQSAQFKRSAQELVGWLKVDFAKSGLELVNFRKLLEVVSEAQLELPKFAESLAHSILGLQRFDNDGDKGKWKLLAEVLFGKLHLPKSRAAVASGAYWSAKKEAEKNLTVPIYLDLADGDGQAQPVADARTARALNQHLLRLNPPPYAGRSRGAPATSSRRTRTGSQEAARARDAYTGAECAVPDKYPEPKLEFLGPTKLFSNNANEAGCFFRYGLGGAHTFLVSEANIRRISAAAFTLAGNSLALTALGGRDSKGRTCRAIPGSRKGKQDLLIAYLEEDPDAFDPYVDLFGAEAASFDKLDFAASTSRVLGALEGKVAANPNQLIRLIAVAALDKANKQISLNRSFTVREVMEAAKSWQTNAANCPPVTLRFFDKNTKKLVTRDRTIPGPLDAASVLNKVWASSSKGGLQYDLHRIINASDAYDLFLGPTPAREGKTRAALQILLDRMHIVFAAAGSLKATSDLTTLSEDARWQVLKAVALIGIFLRQLGEEYEALMKEPTYQLGRLLACADSLHQQYCKHVRGDKMPAQLIGNALFATALEQPVFALARLAERLVPYQAWARTFRNANPEVKSGYEKTLLRLIGECAAHFIEEHEGKFIIRVDELPARMTDTDKAKLVLGYLADHPKTSAPKE